MRHAKTLVLSAALGVAAVAFGKAEKGNAVDTERLLYAIRQVESDNGLTSQNRYQITYRHYADVHRIAGLPNEPSKDDWYKGVRELDRSRWLVTTYWKHYGAMYERNYHRPATAEVLAKIHRVGYAGLQKEPATAEMYWKRVKPHYEKKGAR